MIKTLIKVSAEETYVNIIKATYNKPTDNTICNGEEVESFPTKFKNTRISILTTSI